MDHVCETELSNEPVGPPENEYHSGGKVESQPFGLTAKQKKNGVVFVVRSETYKDGILSGDQRTDNLTEI